MHLLFDARFMALQHTGLGRYTGCLLLALLRGRRPDAHIEVTFPDDAAQAGNAFLAACRPFIDGEYVRLLPLNGKPLGPSHHLRLARLVARSRAEVVFYPHFDTPAWIDRPVRFVVHDLTAHRVPGYVRRWRRLKCWYFEHAVRRGIRRGDRCIAVSASTRADILELIPGIDPARVEVVGEASVLGGLGIAPRATPLLDGGYILYVGDRRPHKGLRRLVDLYRDLRAKGCYGGRLLLVGSRTDYGLDLDRYTAADDGIVHAGCIDDATLARAIVDCDALALLSEYEGFGLPVVEAGCFGRRVLSSGAGSLSEVTPPWACLLPVDLSAEETLRRAAVALTAPLPDATAVARYAAGFSWDRAARALFPEFMVEAGMPVP